MYLKPMNIGSMSKLLYTKRHEFISYFILNTIIDVAPVVFDSPQIVHAFKTIKPYLGL